MRLTAAFVLTSLMFMAAPASAEDWTQLRVDQRRLHINEAGSLILGGWGALSLGTGIGFALTSQGSSRSFWQMTAAWGAVNLALAGVGYYSATQTNVRSYSLARTVAEQRSTQTIFALNIGLDAAYTVTGVWLWDRGLQQPSDMWLGFGRSIVVQGAVLLVLDALLLICHAAGNVHADALVR